MRYCINFIIYYRKDDYVNVWKLWNVFFFYEILILIESKNINVFCSPIIINQINHDYLFQWHQQYKKIRIYITFSYIFYVI